MEVLLPISLALRERTLSHHVASTPPAAAAAAAAAGPPVGVRDVVRWLAEGPLAASREHTVDAAAELTVALTFTHPAEREETAWLQLRAGECTPSYRLPRENSSNSTPRVTNQVVELFRPSRPWHPVAFDRPLLPAIAVAESMRRS